MKQNNYLMTQIYLRYQHGEDLESLFDMAAHYGKVSPGLIQEAARTYLNTKNFITVTLFPEPKSEAENVAWSALTARRLPPRGRVQWDNRTLGRAWITISPT